MASARWTRTAQQQFRYTGRTVQTLSLAEARRIAVASQGLHCSRRRRRVTTEHVAESIRKLAAVQIDFVNVLVPAHYLVLFSRLGPYDRSLLDEVVYRRREFTEQWAHEAAIIPVEHWPLLRHRREAHRVRPWGFETFLEEQPGYLADALELVRARGPLTAAGLPHPDGIPKRIPDAWYTVTRATLEALFGRGLLAVAGRQPNFARVYDLAERVVPEPYFSAALAQEDAERELVRVAARTCGVATAGDLADYFRMPLSRTRQRIQELAGAGELRPVKVEGWRNEAWLHPNAKDPEGCDAAALLSPFDPLVWNRQRAERLFAFEYRIEIYTPAEKRRWGYYVLPFLFHDHLAARVDLKAERQDRRLAVLSAQVEEGWHVADVAGALAAELRQLANWLGLNEIRIKRRGNFARTLSAALKA